MKSAKLDLSTLILAVALGLLTHVIVGYTPFPTGDDFAYAPLADFRADPTLFPKDVQLRMFENHALVYDWIYSFGRDGPGVEPVFRIAIWLQSITVVVALLVILKQLRAPLAALPVVIGTGVAVKLVGLGRGDYGGLISSFFHHHNVALALCLAAAAAALSRRAWLAGIFIGLAAYAQPMTALHGAAIIGLGTLLMRPSDTPKTASVAVLVAIPAAIQVLGVIAETPGVATETLSDLIKDAYRFRAPHHYDPSWHSLAVSTLYLLLGWLGAAFLSKTNRRHALFAIGVMIATTALHLVTLIIYKGGVAEWIPFFILDANRSSPLIFVLGPTFALAGIWHAENTLGRNAVVILLVSVLIINGTIYSAALLGLAVVLLFWSCKNWGNQTATIFAVAMVLLVFPPLPKPETVSEPVIDVLKQIEEETPKEALFVIPASLASFRHYAKRSVYVDFKLFSVAQPVQAAVTRKRIEEVFALEASKELPNGWSAMVAMDYETNALIDCEDMTNILEATGADYYLRIVLPDDQAPDCPKLPRSIGNETLSLYGPRE